MTTVRICPTSITAQGHTDRELCIAISAIVQTAYCVLAAYADYPHPLTTSQLSPDDGYFHVVLPATRIGTAVRHAVTVMFKELAEDYPHRLSLTVEP